MIKVLKPCPFCGCSAVIVKEPLWEGSRGYHGCYLVKVKCMNPLCEAGLPRQGYDTISMTDAEAEEKAVEGWNRRKGDER